MKLFRSTQVLACVLLQPLGASEDGTECGELAAFCVHPSYRGSGRGDSLLDYVEQQARDKGIRRLVRPPHLCSMLRDAVTPGSASQRSPIALMCIGRTRTSSLFLTASCLPISYLYRGDLSSH